MTLSIYLAGPDVFLANALEVGQKKVALCQEQGFKGLFPLDQDEDVGADAAKIYRANRNLIDRADIGLFNLSPFRGPSADAGTVFELGMMAGQGKSVFGYTSSTMTYLERVEQFAGPLSELDRLRWDQFGYKVEDFGLTDNLMIERSIRDAGGTIVLVEEEPSGDPLAALRAFAQCLAEVARTQSQDPKTRLGSL